MATKNMPEGTPLIPVQAFQLSDGSIVAGILEASRRQHELDFRTWYDRDNAVCAYGKPTSEEMLAWLEEHREVVLGLYGIPPSWINGDPDLLTRAILDGLKAKLPGLEVPVMASAASAILIAIDGGKPC